MRNRVLLSLALVLAFALPLAAEPAPNPEPQTQPLSLLSADSTAAAKTCLPEDAIDVGNGQFLVNHPLGAPLPDLAQVSICNCTLAGTCATCATPPCIRCLLPLTCRNRPCLTTINSCRNGVCG